MSLIGRTPWDQECLISLGQCGRTEELGENSRKAPTQAGLHCGIHGNVVRGAASLSYSFKLSLGMMIPVPIKPFCMTFLWIRKVHALNIRGDDASGKYGIGSSHGQLSVHRPILGIAILYPKPAQGLDAKLRVRNFQQKPAMGKNKPWINLWIHYWI